MLTAKYLSIFLLALRPYANPLVFPIALTVLVDIPLARTVSNFWMVRPGSVWVSFLSHWRKTPFFVCDQNHES